MDSALRQLKETLLGLRRFFMISRLHSRPSHAVHSFLTHPLLPNVLGQSTENCYSTMLATHDPWQPPHTTEYSTPPCVERGPGMSATTTLGRTASCRSYPAHTAHLFSSAHSQPCFPLSIYTAPSLRPEALYKVTPKFY